jgi:hypothetical protein
LRNEMHRCPKECHRVNPMLLLVLGTWLRNTP